MITSSSAAAQAWSWQVGVGTSAFRKIVSASAPIAAGGFVCTMSSAERGEEEGCRFAWRHAAMASSAAP